MSNRELNCNMSNFGEFHSFARLSNSLSRAASYSKLHGPKEATSYGYGMPYI